MHLAKEDGVSLNQWIASAVAQKVGVVETPADFFKKRAGNATGAGLMKFLRTAPKAGPETELSQNWKRHERERYDFSRAVKHL